ncbi:efflux RND transporter permease subunit, partial [Clostridium perfringens]|nr:efflux RND transporter permease subunit [Clostridium perfringens]
LRRQVSAIPGFRSFIANPPIIQIGGRSTKSQYQFTLMSPDIDALYRTAEQVLAAIQAVPGLQDVTSDMLLRNPELDVDINRDLASSLGFTAEQI